MPANDPANQPEWTKENLESIIAALYQQVTTDRELRDRLMADPFAVLSERIAIPAEYQGKIVAQDPTAKVLVLNVPAYQESARAEAVTGTTPVTPTPDYLMCTPDPEW